MLLAVLKRNKLSCNITPFRFCADFPLKKMYKNINDVMATYLLNRAEIVRKSCGISLQVFDILDYNRAEIVRKSCVLFKLPQ